MTTANSAPEKQSTVDGWITPGDRVRNIRKDSRHLGQLATVLEVSTSSPRLVIVWYDGEPHQTADTGAGFERYEPGAHLADLEAAYTRALDALTKVQLLRHRVVHLGVYLPRDPDDFVGLMSELDTVIAAFGERS